MMDQRHSEASNALCTQRLSDNVRHGKMDAAKSVTMQDSEHVENGVDIANVTSNKPDIQVKLFDLQLRMHIQFCAQSILQVMHHPYLGHHISLWLNFLLELAEFKRTQIAYLATVMTFANDCAFDWDQIRPALRQKRLEFIEDEWLKLTEGISYGSTRFADWQLNLLRDNSNVFIFPGLRPKMPFFKHPSEPTSSRRTSMRARRTFNTIARSTPLAVDLTDSDDCSSGFGEISDTYDGNSDCDVPIDLTVTGNAIDLRLPETRTNENASLEKFEPSRIAANDHKSYLTLPSHSHCGNEDEICSPNGSQSNDLNVSSLTIEESMDVAGDGSFQGETIWRVNEYPEDICSSIEDQSDEMDLDV